MSPLDLMQKSTTSGARVIDPSQGLVELFHEVGGATALRSQMAEKFKAGDIIEMTIRVSDARGKRQVSNVRAIDANALYSVQVATLATDPILPSFNEWMLRVAFDAGYENLDAGAMISRLTSLRKNPKFTCDLVVGLSYEKAEALVWELNGQVAGRAHFEARQLDESEIPDDIAPPFSVDEIDWVDGYFIPPELRPVFMACARVGSQGQQINVLLTGASGYGKTAAYQALAKFLEFDFIRVNCASITDVKEWFGHHEARNGSTLFVPTRMTELMERGNVVILLDETNRVESWLTNSLFGILDHERATEVHDRKITVGPNVIFGMTMNIGAKYAGTFVADAAFTNRVDITASLGAPPPDVELEILKQQFLAPGDRKSTKVTMAQINAQSIPRPGDMVLNQIISLLGKLREVVDRDAYDVDVTTRTSIKLLNLLRLGITLSQACDYVIVNTAHQEERKALVDIISLSLAPKARK